MQSQTQSQKLKALVDQKFKLFDGNKDGYLQIDEFAEVLNDIYKKMGQEKRVTVKDARDLLSNFDKNGDKRLSKVELLDAFKRFLPLN